LVESEIYTLDDDVRGVVAAHRIHGNCQGIRQGPVRPRKPYPAQSQETSPIRPPSRLSEQPQITVFGETVSTFTSIESLAAGNSLWPTTGTCSATKEGSGQFLRNSHHLPSRSESCLLKQ
jgi:hypothetical protein